MAVRKILKLPRHETFLRTPSEPVRRVTPRVRRLVEDLIDTLATEEGVGLAAPQIGQRERVCIAMIGAFDEVAAGEEREVAIVPLIDPEVLEEEGSERAYDGCLSIPGLQGFTERPTLLRVRSLDLDGNAVEYRFEGMDARVVAHELDHLDGILFFDRLATLEDLFYLVAGEEEEIEFLPYLEVHPELGASPDKRVGLPTQGVPTIVG